jgi:hypothetical protein
METFRGEAHLPGADHSSSISIDIDWLGKEVTVGVSHAEGGFAEWPGLMVQTIGVEEAVFRTRGIPPRFTHWWHIARSGTDDLWGLIIATPDVHGDWQTCPVLLKKVTEEA